MENGTIPSSVRLTTEYLHGTTNRYYSDPEQEFLKGNCTCIRPLADTVSSTFDAWYTWTEAYDDPQYTSSSHAALEVRYVENKFNDPSVDPRLFGHAQFGYVFLDFVCEAEVVPMSSLASRCG